MFILWTKDSFSDLYLPVYCKDPGEVKDAVQAAYVEKKDMVLTKEIAFKHDIQILEDVEPKKEKPAGKLVIPKNEPEEDNSDGAPES